MRERERERERARARARERTGKAIVKGTPRDVDRIERGAYKREMLEQAAGVRLHAANSYGRGVASRACACRSAR